MAFAIFAVFDEAFADNWFLFAAFECFVFLVVTRPELLFLVLMKCFCKN